ncbi:hypothetical protein D3C85_1780650 [compost metagenome]
MHEGCDNADLLLHSLGHFTNRSVHIELKPFYQFLPPGRICNSLHAAQKIQKAPPRHPFHKGNLTRQVTHHPLHNSLLLPSIHAINLN